MLGLPDFCSSTIFGGFFFCKKCGRDFCLQCERYFSDSLETIRKSPMDIPDAARPRLLRCTGGTDANGKVRNQFHVRSDLQPVSSFSADELREHWLALVACVMDDVESTEDRIRLLRVENEDAELRGMVENWSSNNDQRKKESNIEPALSDNEITELYQKSTNPSADDIADPANLAHLSLPFMFITAERLNHETFDLLWTRGEPIVVDGVGQRFKHTWTPDTLIERFGSEPCCLSLLGPVG